jgi:pyruvate kinase
VRLNLAHDDPTTHERAAANAREQAEEVGRRVGVLVDLPGPKMRTGSIAGGSAALVAGNDFTLVGADIEGDAEHASTTVEGLATMVSAGDQIYLSDGAIVLEVADVSDSDVRTKVMRGGELRSRKGIHIPGAERDVEAFTEADRRALEVGLSLGADLVGLSFVRDGEDIRRARAALPDDESAPLVMAKIETRSAVEHLDEIIDEADTIMVARGDLGIQTPLEQVALLQKQVIAACNRAGAPVVTATQMLESMTHAPLPTRAEVADVANAVLDGTDALMLSEETAVGDHPADAVTTMAAIARSAEPRCRHAIKPSPREQEEERVSWAVARAAVQAAEDLGVAAILCPTRTGATPRRVAAFRPSMPIVALSGNERTIGFLALVWGVVPVCVPAMGEAADTGAEVSRAARAGCDAGLIGGGDLVAVVAGSPGPRAGRTDYVRIARA